MKVMCIEDRVYDNNTKKYIEYKMRFIEKEKIYIVERSIIEDGIVYFTILVKKGYRNQYNINRFKIIPYSKIKII